MSINILYSFWYRFLYKLRVSISINTIVTYIDFYINYRLLQIPYLRFRLGLSLTSMSFIPTQMLVIRQLARYSAEMITCTLRFRLQRVLCRWLKTTILTLVYPRLILWLSKWSIARVSLQQHLSTSKFWISMTTPRNSRDRN